MRTRKQLSIERLHELFVLDHATGQLFWKARADYPVQWNTRYAGKVVGTLTKTGYIRVNIGCSLYYAHTIVWAMINRRWPENEIDHRSGVGSDNSVGNLREAFHAEQGQNLKLRADNTSGYTGTWFHKQIRRWVAEITVNKKRHCLGTYKTAEQARDAYREAKAKLHLFQPIVREA